MEIRTRFAPSPTGYLHLGGVRTALYSSLYARKMGGKFILRIEDTDRERSTTPAIKAIFDGMHWLGLNCDEGPFYQTARSERYQEVIEKLLIEGKAYRCFCSKERLQALREDQMRQKLKPRYDGHCRELSLPEQVDRSHVIRFKNPLDGEVIVKDQVCGEVRFKNSELDDLIILRSNQTPTYNFCVVVDDSDMKITHVIRGDDHLNNTPRQMNILSALGAPLPNYAHIPMILGPDGKKMSKRTGAVGVMDYRDQGILPEAMLNYMVRLGWSHGDQEIFSIEEMIDLFDLSDLNRSAAAFDPQKLIWFNQHYLKTLPIPTIVQQLSWHMRHLDIDLRQGPPLEKIVEAQRERSKTLVEMAEKSRYFYADFPGFAEKAAENFLVPESKPILEEIRSQLASIAVADWNQQNIHNAIQHVMAKLDIKMGKVAQPIRVAVTGDTISPSIDVTLLLIGQERSIERLDRAINFIAE